MATASEPVPLLLHFNATVAVNAPLGMNIDAINEAVEKLISGEDMFARIGMEERGELPANLELVSTKFERCGTTLALPHAKKSRGHAVAD